MNNAHLTVESTAGWRDDVPVEHISELVHQPGQLIWLDLSSYGPTDLTMLREELGFHELALEDAASRHQRPKCDLYDDYYFIVVYAISAGQDDIELQELQLFWGPNYLVTLHQRPLAVVDEARLRWQRGVRRADSGVGYLVYSLLDSLVDEYMRVQDTVVDRVQDIEENIFPKPRENVLADIFRMRKDVLKMRRVLSPTRDVLNEIVRHDLPLYDERLRPYFVDVYDHNLRVLEGMDTYRDLLAAALDAYLSAVSNQLNQTVKRMTALTLIVMVPTLIAGVYGMNFTPLVPAEDSAGGFWFAVVLMSLVAGTIALILKRLDWI